MSKDFRKATENLEPPGAHLKLIDPTVTEKKSDGFLVVLKQLYANCVTVMQMYFAFD